MPLNQLTEPHTGKEYLSTKEGLNFQRAMKAHYKTERDRSEQCLSDIILILDQRGRPEAAVIDDILKRLIEHYQRDDEMPAKVVQMTDR